jgi:cation diffusion facilitator CzcD-associated flavoprotein CzcO
MTYRNTPFPEEIDLFPRADSVCKYIQSYAEKHEVYRHALTGVMVTRLYKTAENKKWMVHCRKAKPHPGQNEDAESVTEFDHVAIANGHYEKVMIPQIPGLK